MGLDVTYEDKVALHVLVLKMLPRIVTGQLCWRELVAAESVCIKRLKNSLHVMPKVTNILEVNWNIL